MQTRVPPPAQQSPDIDDSLDRAVDAVETADIVRMAGLLHEIALRRDLPTVAHHLRLALLEAERELAAETGVLRHLASPLRRM